TPLYPPGVVSRPAPAESNRRGAGRKSSVGFGVRPVEVQPSHVEERRLLRGRGGLATAGLGGALLPLLRPCSSAGCGPRELPALLVGDAVTLPDHEEIDETRERAREERQVPLPVARRVGERAHLVERERERRAVAPPRREAEVGENLPLVDARGGRGRRPPARHWTAPAPPTRTRTSYASRSGWFGIAWTVTLRSISAPSRSIASRPSPSR